MSRPSRSERALPTGDLTFLFTDIEGSTRLWERASESMRRALVRHDELLNKVVDRNSGFVFKTVGDSFFCVFESPHRALRAAIEIQYALKNEPWPQAVGEVRVRIAMHSGTAELRRRDYFGPTVNRVARLSAAGHGGQILLSSTTAALVRDRLGDVTLYDLGLHRLRDLGDPDRIFQATAPGLHIEFLAPATLDAAPNNLPAQISSFVGRVEELARLRDLMSEHSLVTLVGLGGMGKTRLAIEFGAESVGKFKDGCWFVALKEKDDPADIVQTTATAMRVAAVAGEPIEETLLESLLGKRALLVVDNAEHLLEGVAEFVKRVLETVPTVRVLVTSREPLHVHGERVLRLGGLDDAISLFLDRARASGYHTRDSEDDARAIAGICKKLQGIPLAIELAAARAAAGTLWQLEDHLSSQLRLAARDEDEEHNPLRAMLGWSYRLLRPNERRFFARLAIFEGSFTFEAAGEIAFSSDLGRDALTMLSFLVDKSLLTLVTGEDGEGRYHMLDVVREFASECLRRTDESRGLMDRACNHYLRVVEALSSPNQTEAQITAIAREWDNVRAVLRFAFEERVAIHVGRAIVRCLWQFWMATGRATEGWHWINRALEGGDLPARLRAEFLQLAARLAASRNDYVSLEPMAKLLVEMHDRSGDARELGMALQLLASAKLMLGRVDEGEQFQRQALEQFRAVDDRRGIALALGNLGWIALEHRSNYDLSRELFLRSFEIFRELKVPINCAEVLGNLSVSSMRAGDLVQALGYGKASLEIFRRMGNDAAVAQQLLNIAEIFMESGKPDEAIEELRNARRALGERANRQRLADYFEMAFKLAVELKVYDLAGNIYGFAQRHRHTLRTPLTSTERASIDSRYQVLKRTMDARDLNRLTREGAVLAAEAVEGLIERLGPAPKQPSAAG